MMRSIGKWLAVTIPALVLAVAVAHSSLATPMGQAGTPAAQYNDKGELLFPADYRHWTYLSAGFGMSYQPVTDDGGDPPFDTVFADPKAERAFRETGHWPEGSVLIVEIRRSTSKGSINVHGAYQSGGAVAVEAHVRDSKRFKGGWGFFAFKGIAPAAKIPDTADCYSCHLEHAAVDTTFVQFYPTLLPIAAAKNTLSPAYQAAEKAATKP